MSGRRVAAFAPASVGNVGPGLDILGLAVEGPGDDTWQLVRTIMGATKVEDAQPGSIRGDFATTTSENLVHGSDGPESAAHEISLWFPNLV